MPSKIEIPLSSPLDTDKIFIVEYPTLNVDTWDGGEIDTNGNDIYRTTTTFYGYYRPTTVAAWSQINGTADMKLTVKSSAVDGVPTIYALTSFHRFLFGIPAEMLTMNANLALEDVTITPLLQRKFKIDFKNGSGATAYADSSAALNVGATAAMQKDLKDFVTLSVAYGSDLIALK
jgi:hypothetical protein